MNVQEEFVMMPSAAASALKQLLPAALAAMEAQERGESVKMSLYPCYPEADLSWTGLLEYAAFRMASA